MIKNIVTIAIIGILLSSILVFPVSSDKIETLSGTTLYVDDDGTADYTKIQDAINDSSNGDTVFVYNGTYHEYILVKKDNISLIGENKETTIIDASHKNRIYISSNGTTIEGFTIKKGDIRGGVHISNSKNNFIFNNIFKENYCGIYLYQSNENNISANIIKSNNNGIVIYASNYNNVIENEIEDNAYSGIVLGGSSGSLCKFNKIKNNMLSNNKYGILGYTGASHGIPPYVMDNEIINNIISKNDVGISESIYGNIIKNNNFEGNAIAFTFKGIDWPYTGDTQLDGNYWNRPRFLPKLVIIFSFNDFKLKLLIDWHPAKEPYGIDG